MGEITRHFNIYLHNVDALKKYKINVDYSYLYIGNFLTDLSQFVDPFANISSKKKIRNISYQEYGWKAKTFIFENILDDLMGVIDKQDDSKRIGALSNYFRNICLAITHLVFSEDIQKRKIIQSRLFSGIKQQIGLPDIGSMSSEMVDKIFEKYFTQYYPHEHLDLPPYIINGNDRQHSGYYEKDSSGLIGYLNNYKRYLSEEFFKLESEWRNINNLPDDEFRKKEPLIKLDKLLHGVEDYFYHSNFLELNLLFELYKQKHNGILSSLIDVDYYSQTKFIDDAMIFLKTLPYYHDILQNSYKMENEWKRKLFRRSRFPLYDASGHEKLDVSDSSLDTVYTGGFEQNDMFHTIIGGLEGLEGLFTKILSDEQPILSHVSNPLLNSIAKQGISSEWNKLHESPLVLVRAFFNSDMRDSLVNKKELKKAQEEHKKQLTDGSYLNAVEKIHAQGWINKQARTALIDTINLDISFLQNHHYLLSIGEFLLQLLSMAQIEYNQSVKKKNEMNNSTDFVKDNKSLIATDNGASAELIGTHTLMAKDSKHGQPLFEEANVLAEWASFFASFVFFRTVQENTYSIKGIDWFKLLNYLIKYPSSSSWENKVLKYFRENNKIPTLEELGLTPEKVIEMFSVKRNSMTSETTKHFNSKEQLEERYKSLEKKVK